MTSPLAPRAATIGHYRVLEVLGEGGMGEVVRARDERLGRDVAIKRMKNVGGEALADFQARFEAEARALAQLAHPSVVQIYDLGVHDAQPYLVMELIDGPSLRALLKQHGPLPAAKVRALGIQLARALEAAHGRGILHRDVKPANVLQAPGGAWKLADFGVAHMPDSEMTSTGQFIGTPAYAAPEALALAQFSAASDVFSLAAMLAEAVSGQKPRRDETLAELIARAQRKVELSGVPDELALVLAPAMSLSPKARPSAAQLADLLAGSPDTPQILAALEEQAAAGDEPADATAIGKRRAPGKRAATPVAEADAVAAVDSPAPVLQTIGVPDATAMPSAALAGSGATIGVPDATAAPPSRASQQAVHTVGVPDATAQLSPRAAPPHASHPSMSSAQHATPRAATPPPTHAAPPQPLALSPAAALPPAAAVVAPTATAIDSSHLPMLKGRGLWLALGLGAVIAIAITGTCLGHTPSSKDGAAAVPGALPASGGPGVPLPGLLAPDEQAPLRFEMPPELDRKGAKEWADVARSVNEGKLKRALDKLRKLEDRHGESPESAGLRRWLEQNAHLEHPREED